MPEPARGGNRVAPSDVRTMFDRIAPIYDAMNTVMTAGLDARWRRAAVDVAELSHGMRAIDVACGSGALTRELSRVVGPGGEVLGVDISPGMLDRARRRRSAAPAAPIRYELGDALDLPVPDGSQDAATIAFGLRNVADYARCLAEMRRAVRVGGRVVVLELATPERGVGRFITRTWFERVVPILGRLAGGGSAYAYLPSSVRGYPAPDRVAALMREAGLADVTWRRLRPGLVTLHVGRRA
jgi:demethylmenaquinone methyltransferase/2-methoxy-6-polyprenyl-1,4-benzoquinol methylase